MHVIVFHSSLNDTHPTYLYTLSLHDALPIYAPTRQFYGGKVGIDATHKGLQEGTREWPPEIEMSPEVKALVDRRWDEYRSEEHTSELQSRVDLVCRLLLEKKKIL